jgi:hypothetical protein
MKTGSLLPLITPEFYKLILLAIVISITCNACGLFDSDVNEATHKTQIVVGLAGHYAQTEVATVSIDGVVIGTASKNEVATKEVEPGMHKISAVDSKGKPAWSSETIEVLEQQTFKYTLLCDPAKLIVHVDQQCEQPGKTNFPLEVQIYDINSQKVPIIGSPYFYAGDNGTVQFDHGQLALYVVDAKNNIEWQNPSTYFQYGSTLSVTVYCQ